MLRKTLIVFGFGLAGALIAAAAVWFLTTPVTTPALADGPANVTVIHKTSNSPWPLAPTRADQMGDCIIGVCQDV